MELRRAPQPGREKICYTSQPRAVSSAVEHSPHTGGATGSIPVPPTNNQRVMNSTRLKYEKRTKLRPAHAGLRIRRHRRMAALLASLQLAGCTKVGSAAPPRLDRGRLTTGEES